MSRASKARRLLSGKGVAREDSDDELGNEDYGWEWIYDKAANAKGRQIVGARHGPLFSCSMGDMVLLKADSAHEAWVGIICGFREDEETGDKMAHFMWFSSEKEIRNKEKKRCDFLPVGSALHLEDSRLTTTERAVHHSSLGLEFLDNSQRQSEGHVESFFRRQLSHRTRAAVVTRRRQGIRVSKRLQHQNSYLHRRVPLGEGLSWTRGYARPHRSCSDADQGNTKKAQEGSRR